MSTRDHILAWVDQFENDHYTFDLYGQNYTVHLPRETVEAVLNISITLVDRVVAAKGELHTADYEELEAKVRKQYPEDSAWLLHIIMEVVFDDHLFGRYKDIEPLIGKLMPRGYPMGSAPYLLLVRPELQQLVYAVIRHVDDAEENYESLVYTFFVSTLAKGWGEGGGWSKTEEGNWMWKREENNKADF